MANHIRVRLLPQDYSEPPVPYHARRRRVKIPATLWKWALLFSVAICVSLFAGGLYAQHPAHTPARSAAKPAQTPVRTPATPPQTVTGNIVDLVQQKTIEVTSSGDGIESVTVRIHRLVPERVSVQIPVGTYFVSAEASAQNMITTKATTVLVSDDEWQEVSTSVACTNRPKDAPDSSDSFTVERAPNQQELASLMPVLDAAGVTYAVRQAAVWIVTDNADYSDLGELIESTNGFDGSRVINEPEAAQAMMLCDRAGIDITHKAIWADRNEILANVTDPEVKAWLQRKL